MQLHTLDPLRDSRWDDLVNTHPAASVFHLRGWLEALALSYNYEPVVFTSSGSDEPLTDGLLACRVSSWITGRRLVSLPFSDHCEPLSNASLGDPEFSQWMRAECERGSFRYAEIRPLSIVANLHPDFVESAAYCFHTLDLTSSLSNIFDRLHKDSMQRRIRKAEREGLSYEQGCSPELLEDFYRLQLKTRVRHGVIPQPRIWFRSLVHCLGEQIVIRVARSKGTAIAALLTIRHKSTAVYKYGCSDERYHNLGGMPFLFWNFITESKATGVRQVDLGRSDLDNPGLLTFKDRLGATRTRLTYFRYTRDVRARRSAPTPSPLARRMYQVIPQKALPAAGRLLYRHFG